MKTRMQPIGKLWKALPRIVRDLAVQCGKAVELRAEGNETELDKSILEAIKDPLTHLVRNAVDHGIEAAEVRTAAGKPAAGRLTLRAFHEGGQVQIEITDDGGGIDPERLKQTALERRLFTPAQAERMSESELLQLIFLPGFSTAATITNISGRGVGMDVVKTNIEKIGGTVELRSRLGHGTSVRINIPLTLAIIPALLVRAGGDRYAIPQVNLLELIRLKGERATRGIEYIHGTPVCRLRNQLLPLVDLCDELEVEPELEPRDEPVVDIVVLQADRRTFGLVVEAIGDTEEIVVKPLARMFKGVPLFAGATILGDGRVALIVDVPGLARRAGVLGDCSDTPIPVVEAEAPGEPCQTLLLFRVGAAGRMALPLSPVARLEEFPVSALESSIDGEVVQYRGHVLPLIRLDRVLNVAESAGNGSNVPVIVCSHLGRTVGLVVGQILDIVETPLRLQPAAAPGVLGTAVIQQRVTDVLNLPEILKSASTNAGVAEIGVTS
jgi:two-component system chemotaxis sensor kinase CheA